MIFPTILKYFLPKIYFLYDLEETFKASPHFKIWYAHTLRASKAKNYFFNHYQFFLFFHFKEPFSCKWFLFFWFSSSSFPKIHFVVTNVNSLELLICSFLFAFLLLLINHTLLILLCLESWQWWYVTPYHVFHRSCEYKTLLLVVFLHLTFQLWCAHL